MELEQKEINEEELQLYDRQRFIGVEVQRRLINARIFVTPMGGVNTELAKNLVLCGTNIVIGDSQSVTEDDIETNFLLTASDLGANRGEIIRQRLQEMNPMVQITLVGTFSVSNALSEDGERFLQQFNIIATSTKSFEEMNLWTKVSQKINKPVYNLVCCGLYGFFYATLGSEFTYTGKKPRQGQFLNGKLLQSEYQDYEDVTIPGVEFDTTLLKDKKGTKDVYKAITVIRTAQARNLVYDAYCEGQDDVIEQIWGIALEMYPSITQKKDFFTRFFKFYGIEYCPVYSVIGSIASQEFIKVIGRDSEPGVNWFCYDSQEGYGKIENVSGAGIYARKDRPDLRHIAVDDTK